MPRGSRSAAMPRCQDFPRSTRRVRGKPAHEADAFFQLLQAHIFIRLVGLLNGARPADDSGNADLLEQAGLGAIGNSMAAVGFRKMKGKRFRR